MISDANCIYQMVAHTADRPQMIAQPLTIAVSGVLAFEFQKNTFCLKQL